MKYWNCEDYVGFGISSHSCVGNKRFYATNSIEHYINHYSQKNPESEYEYVTMYEELSNAEFLEEYIMMRLRLADGLDFSECEKRFGINFEEKYLHRAEKYIASGHILYDAINKSIRLSDNGMYISNYILSDILDLS